MSGARSARDINSARPNPLKIHRDSRLIHKSSSSASSTAAGATTTSNNHPRRHPVIIYTHSPKVIHTQASDFMALVQKLTGRSQSGSPNNNNNDGSSSSSSPPPPPLTSNDAKLGAITSDDSSSSSDNCSGHIADGRFSCSSLSSSTTTMMPSMGFGSLSPPPSTNPFLVEMPHFAPPSSSDLFCFNNPSTFFGCTDPSTFSPSVPDVSGAISPSAIEAMKTYHHEY